MADAKGRLRYPNNPWLSCRKVKSTPPMPSTELQKLLKFLRTPQADPNPSLEARRAMVDGWADMLPPAPEMTFERATIDDRINAEWVRAPQSRSDRLVLYFHGGGFTMGSAKNYRDLASRLARAAHATALTIDYRLAPEHIYPAGLDDCVSAYQWLLRDGWRPGQIALAGDSAGAGLVLSTMLRLRAQGLALPSAAVCISPFADLSLSGESMVTNAELDPIVRKRSAMGSVQRYIADGSPIDPLVSPVFASFESFPPLLILVGSHESLLDDSRRVAAAAKAAGVEVELARTTRPQRDRCDSAAHASDARTCELWACLRVDQQRARCSLAVWDEMFHIWPYFAAMLPEGQQAVERAGSFIDQIMRRQAPLARQEPM